MTTTEHGVLIPRNRGDPSCPVQVKVLLEGDDSKMTQDLPAVELSPSALSKLRAARKAAEDAYASGDWQQGDLLADDYLRFLRDEVGPPRGL
jgi:hypothetical protein